MSKIYYTGNVYYLPINGNDLGPAKFYICVDVNGNVYMNDLKSKEQIDEMFAKKQIKQADAIFPMKKEGIGSYKNLR